MMSLDFSIDLILPVDSASNRNELSRIFLGGKGKPARKANSLTVICEPIV
jgi:hypothetical protein